MSATNRGTQRKANDYYPTPKYTVESLLRVLDLSNVQTFAEPCMGDGAIINLIDVPLKYSAELSSGIDYFDVTFDNVDLIITNPPFSLAIDFLIKSLSEAKSVFYLLPHSILGSKDRVTFWQNNRPTHMLNVPARPSFTGKGTDAREYAWFGWDKLGICTLPQGIHVLDYHKPRKEKL